ncbi:LOB domain-containing protein 16-like [Rutidosis leptorrhynchoides]|uniref:LOB domain-containing protein 16-like n=1 Tax=Rutidosis leptorrhynchoides TaxID=125765 RepID=UPI003A999220
MSSTAAPGTGSPCGACKFLRRKCATDCIFAPYFCSEQGPTRFAAIHKVFGASNVSKLLLHVPVADRCEAVVTIAYEAQARIKDPVYGCVAHIFALQQQVTCLQTQLMQMKAQMAQGHFDLRNVETTQWSSGSVMYQNYPSFANIMNGNISPQSSLESVDHHNNNEEMVVQSSRDNDDHNHNYHDIYFHQQIYNNKKRPFPSDLGELQELAVRMMRN